MRAPWDIHESNHETHHGSRLFYWWLRFRNVKGGSKRRYTITTIDAYSEEEPQIANGLSRRTRPLFSFSRSLFALFFASEELPETPPLRGELALLLAHSLRGSDTRGV